MQSVVLILGALLTLTGAGLLVLAFRQGQAGRRDDERRTFRLAVVGLAAGSVLFLVTMMLSGS